MKADKNMAFSKQIKRKNDYNYLCTSIAYLIKTSLYHYLPKHNFLWYILHVTQNNICTYVTRIRLLYKEKVMCFYLSFSTFACKFVLKKDPKPHSTSKKGEKIFKIENLRIYSWNKQDTSKTKRRTLFKLCLPQKNLLAQMCFFNIQILQVTWFPHSLFHFVQY